MEKKQKIRTIYNDPNILRNELEKYFIDCKKVGNIPTKIGMLNFLKMSENTLSSWKQKKKNTFLQQINWAHKQIEDINLQRYLQSSPNASAWYLERAYASIYSQSTKIDVKNDNNTTPIVIQLENKGKNKI